MELLVDFLLIFSCFFFSRQGASKLYEKKSIVTSTAKIKHQTPRQLSGKGSPWDGSRIFVKRWHAWMTQLKIDSAKDLHGGSRTWGVRASLRGCATKECFIHMQANANKRTLAKSESWDRSGSISHDVSILSMRVRLPFKEAPKLSPQKVQRECFVPQSCGPKQSAEEISERSVAGPHLQLLLQRRGTWSTFLALSQHPVLGWHFPKQSSFWGTPQDHNTITAIPHTTRYLLGELSTPRLVLWFAQTYLPHSAAYRAIFVRYPPQKQGQNNFCNAKATSIAR